MEIVGVVDPDEADGDIGAIAAHAALLMAHGADLVDVDTVTGGPRPLDVRRLVRLVRRLAAEGVPVGVTTTSADVVVGAVDAGAQLVSDPSGASMDRFMPPIIAGAGVRYVLGQSVALDRALLPATPLEFRELAVPRAQALEECGLAADMIVLDSGVGQYSHTATEWGILEHLEDLADCGYPVLVDASLPTLFPATGGDVTEEDDAASLGVCVVAASVNAWGVRVSNVARASTALRGLSVWSHDVARTQIR